VAMINCPNCGKQISDKALSCPSCGLELNKGEKPKEVARFCEECGVEIPNGITACPACGCPVPVKEEVPQNVDATNISLSKTNKKKRNIFIGVAVIVALAVIAVMYFTNQQKEKAAVEYASNLELASNTMLSGGATAEEAGGLFHDVWYNTIYEEYDSTTDKYTRTNSGSGNFYDDFNDALAILLGDADFQIKISMIEDNQETVKNLMKELMNPPEEYQEAYDALKDYYDAYLELTGIVISPTGNLQTFTSNFNDADSNLLKYYKAMQVYIE